MATQLFKCSICKEKLPFTSFYPKAPQGRDTREVTYECKSCRKSRDRSSEKWNRSLKRSDGAVCLDCHYPRKLVDGERCKGCLAAIGWKVCSHCRTQRLLHLDYTLDPRSRTCDECLPTAMNRTRDYLLGVQKRKDTKAAIEGAPEGAKARAAALWRSYRITWKAFSELLDAQGGLCAICRRDIINQPCVDHDHATKDVRGILCAQCNVGLGMFADSLERLIAAIDYLKKKGPTVVAVSPLSA